MYSMILSVTHKTPTAWKRFRSLNAGDARDFTTFGCETCRLTVKDEGVRMLRDPAEARQNLLDPGVPFVQ